MGCYQCGSDLGDESRLCPTCIQARKAQRAGQVGRIQEQYSQQNQKPDITLALAQSPQKRLLVCVMIVFITCLYSLLLGPFTKIGILPALLFGVMLGASLIAFITWLFFWMHLIVMEPMWAIIAFFLPFVVYRYIFINWEESKIYFFIHIGSIAVIWLTAGALAAITGASIFEILLIHQLYTHGHRDALEVVE